MLLQNSSVQYYSEGAWTQLHGEGWASEGLALEADLSDPAAPQVVIGLYNGSVQWFDGTGWTQLSAPAQQQVTQMGVRFPSPGVDAFTYPTVVIGLGAFDGNTKKS